MFRIHISLIALVVVALGACATNSTVPEPVNNKEFVFADEYRIGVGDNLSVNVYGHDSVSSVVTVRPDGKITLPIAGDLLVGGKIPEDVAKEITDLLKVYIRTPIVTVTLANIAGSDYLSRVRITGAVQDPQSIEFKNGMTIMDVVLEAGGVSEFAKSSRTKLYRQGQKPISIRLDKILSGRDLSTNVRLKPGDVVSVPERIF